ncbi:MAG: hypothetical protein H3C69_00550, partial [Candidatus Promineofilum sp.]|nr:hypothetical protein [Promineifilum sp.]
MKRLIRIALIVAVFLAIVYGVTQFMRLVGDIRDPRTGQYWQWARGSESTRADLVTVQRDACPGAPFILPADGFIGLLYADS